jgi:hypothetical protein
VYLCILCAYTLCVCTSIYINHVQELIDIDKKKGEDEKMLKERQRKNKSKTVRMERRMKRTKYKLNIIC